MKINNGSITILCGGHTDGVVIEIRDNDAATIFCKIELDAKQFVAALGRLSNVEAKSMEVFNLDRVGKKHEHKKLEFEIPESGYDGRKEIAIKTAKEKCPEGWIPDLYFGSQDSFFMKDGKEYARCIIRRYI